MSDRRVTVLPGGRAVVVENGPMRLVIQAFTGQVAEIELAKEAADYACHCLARVAISLPTLRKSHGSIGDAPGDVIAKVMVESVRTIGDPDLTPMAAVAGTIADFVADWLFARRATKVIVDNGGDVAIRLQPGATATVGLRPVITSPTISHVVHLNPAWPCWGVTTSGMGGRSLTRGIASAVTVFAASATLADAAATAIANACIADDENILQLPAIQVDPNTDLGELPVTVRASDLAEETIVAALENGWRKAEVVRQQQIIRGAILVVGGRMALTAGFTDFVGDVHSYDAL